MLCPQGWDVIHHTCGARVWARDHWAQCAAAMVTYEEVVVEQERFQLVQLFEALGQPAQLVAAEAQICEGHERTHTRAHAERGSGVL